MAITPSEKNALVQAIFAAFGEDVEQMGRLVAELRNRLPAVDWADTLTTLASTWQPFIDSGLSIDWWVAEVLRQADVHGGI